MEVKKSRVKVDIYGGLQINSEEYAQISLNKKKKFVTTNTKKKLPNALNFLTKHEKPEKAKITNSARLNEQKEMKQCTFSPRINKKPLITKPIAIKKETNTIPILTIPEEELALNFKKYASKEYIEQSSNRLFSASKLYSKKKEDLKADYYNKNFPFKPSNLTSSALIKQPFFSRMQTWCCKVWDNQNRFMYN